MADWRTRLEAGEGERFADGNMAEVIRLEDRVVRSRSPWSDASHAVLRHLEAHGFEGVPGLIDTSDDHEVLSFLPGESIPPDLAGYRDDERLITVTGAIRSLQDALRHFPLPADVQFPEMPSAPRGGSLLCHNDLAPWNTIMQGRAFAGFVD